MYTVWFISRHITSPEAIETTETFDSFREAEIVFCNNINRFSELDLTSGMPHPKEVVPILATAKRGKVVFTRPDIMKYKVEE